METMSLSNTQATYNAIPLMDIVRSSFGGGAVDIPVEHSTPFTFFKHINGVPAHSEGGGYPLAKLEAIDALIEHLINTQQRPQPAPAAIQPTSFSEGAMDEMIEQISSQLHSALQSGLPAIQQSLGISMGPAASPLGLVVNALA